MFAKDVNVSGFAGPIPSSLLARQDLEAEIVKLTNRNTPLRDIMPRIRGEGRAHLWNQRIRLGMLPTNNSPLEIFYLDGATPTQSDPVYVQKTAAYAYLGVTGVITGPALSSNINGLDKSSLQLKCMSNSIFFPRKSLPEGMKYCKCGCGELIPTVNKLGKPARFKHGHNLTRELSKLGRSMSPGHIVPHSGDFGRFGVHRRGIPPTNAWKKGHHASPATEYKLGHIDSEKNRIAVSKATKFKWANDPEYRKKCLDAARSMRENTSIEKKVKGFLRELGIHNVPNRYFRFERIKGKKHGCKPDIRIPKLMLIIHCDSYWHTRPKKIEEDKYIDKKLREFGYRIIRLPEEQIKKLTKEKLLTLINRAVTKGLPEAYA